MSRPTRATAGGRAYLDLQNLARREERSTQELLVLYVLAAPREVRPQGRHAPGRAQRPPPDRRRRSARDPPEQPDREVLARVTEIASTTITPEDGVRYLTDTAKARIIREGDLYSGIRVTMNATVADAGVKLQLDINFGDPMTPAPSTITYPGLRDEFPPVRILGYPLPTVLAEKLTTAIRLGAGNSRIRDVADVWTLTGVHDLDATQMRAALETTAAHRQITLRPLAVSLVDLATARADTYTTYRRRLGQAGAHLPEDLTTLIGDVITFVDPSSRVRRRHTGMRSPAGGPHEARDRPGVHCPSDRMIEDGDHPRHRPLPRADEPARLRARIGELEVENARLLKLLELSPRESRPPGPAQTGWYERNPGPVTNLSTPDHKVAFFAGLFAARTDVYATRWENARLAKAGWVPAVRGGWRKGSAPRTARSPPFALDVVRAHLSGQIHLGLYPLLDDDRTWWLAADFDGPAAMLDALAYLKAARARGVPAALEISRSGLGAHVWVFFTSPIPAETARRLGTVLLREAMALRGRMDLSSYDRLFPSQDALPAGAWAT